MLLVIALCGSLASLYLDIFVPMWYGIALFMFIALITLDFSLFSRILFIMGYSDNDRVVLKTHTILKLVYKYIPIVIIIAVIQGMIRILVI